MKRFLGLLLATILILGSLAGCTSAEFEVSPITITPNEVTSGESLTISVDVTNVGSADGVYAAKLTIKNEEVATKDVTITAGATETVSFTLTEETPGNYTVSLNDLTGSFEVLKLHSAQEIVDSVIKALDNIKTYEFEWDLTWNIAAELEGKTYEGIMVHAASGALDPENRQMKFDMTANYKLPEEDEIDVGTELYLNGDVAYMITDAPGILPAWNKVEIKEAAWEEEYEQMNQQLTMLIEDHTELLHTAEVEVIGSEKINEVDCYVLQLTPDMKQLLQYVWLQSALGDILYGDMIMPLLTDQFLEGISCSFSVKQWVCKDTYFLTKEEADVAIKVTPEALGSTEEVEMTMDIVVDFLAYNHNQPISIQVPPEAEEAGSEPQAVPVPEPTPVIVINFMDKMLEDSIRARLNMLGEDITKQKLSELFGLEATEKGISNLSGIEYCVNLTKLNLGYNNISDISALSSLNSLSELILTNNQISDISPLSSLANLKYLSLERNPLSETSVNVYIPQLEQRGVTVIWSLPVVTFPDVSLQNVIMKTLGKENFTAADLAELTELDASYKGITDLSGIENCVNLIKLSLSSNQISDISALSSLTRLEKLALGYNDISDISALSSLINLKGFGAGDNRISDISALSSLTNLEHLYLGKNDISDISPLLNLPNLIRVQLGNNPLSTASRYDYTRQLQERGVLVILYLTPPPDWW